MRAKRQEALRSEQLNLSQEIIRWTQKQVFAVSRKTLADLAATSLEERMVEVFVERLRTLTGAAKEALAAALKASAQPARVRSAFDLPPELQSKIESAVKESFGAKTLVQFQTAPELISGIELSTNGQKVAWSIADYLATLEKSAGELLHKDDQPELKPDPKPTPKAEAKANPDPKVVAKPDPNPVAKPEAKADAKPSPKRESKRGAEQVSAIPKVDH